MTDPLDLDALKRQSWVQCNAGARALIAELEACRAERDDAKRSWLDFCDGDRRVLIERADEAEAEARNQANHWEIEKVHAAEQRARAERAEAERDQLMREFNDEYSRAEKAEADRDALRAGHGHDSALCMSWRDRAERAEAEREDPSIYVRAGEYAEMRARAEKAEKMLLAREIQIADEREDAHSLEEAIARVRDFCTTWPQDCEPADVLAALERHR